MNTIDLYNEMQAKIADHQDMVLSAASVLGRLDEVRSFMEALKIKSHEETSFTGGLKVGDQVRFKAMPVSPILEVLGFQEVDTGVMVHLKDSYWWNGCEIGAIEKVGG